MELQQIQTAVLWTTIAEMVILSLAILCTLVYVYCKPKSFRWLAKMLWLCLLMNLCTISLVVCIHLEQRTLDEAYKEKLALAMGFSIGTFNFTTNTVHWLFSFKYWVISYEVPQKLYEAPRESKETLYSKVNLAFIVANLSACVWLGYSRGRMTELHETQSAGIADAINKTELALDAVIVLLLMAAIVLANALCRLCRSFGQNRKLEMKHRLMALHVFMLTVHIGVYIWSQVCFRRASENPDNMNLQIINEYSRIALFTSQSFVEAFLIYLFISFTNPIEIRVYGEERVSEEDEYESNERFGSMSALLFIKNMPTMIRSQENYELVQNDSLWAQDHRQGDVYNDLCKPDQKARGSQQQSSSGSDYDQAGELTSQWGEQEACLRQAIYCSFIKAETFNGSRYAQQRSQSQRFPPQQTSIPDPNTQQRSASLRANPDNESPAQQIQRDEAGSVKESLITFGIKKGNESSQSGQQTSSDYSSTMQSLEDSQKLYSNLLNDSNQLYE